MRSDSWIKLDKYLRYVKATWIFYSARPSDVGKDKPLHNGARNSANMLKYIIIRLHPMSKYEKSTPPFAFVYTKQGGIVGINVTTTYDSITKELERGNATKQLSQTEEDSLKQTFSDNGFFEATTFSFPGSPGGADFFEYTILATMDLKGAFISWRDDSPDAPPGLKVIANTIDQIAIP